MESKQYHSDILLNSNYLLSFTAKKIHNSGAPYDLQAAAKRLQTDFLQFCLAKESAKLLFMNRLVILQNMAKLRYEELRITFF